MAGIVTAGVVDVPGHDVGVVTLGVRTDRVRVVAEPGEPERGSGRLSGRFLPLVLGVYPDRRTCGAGQPVDRYVGEQDVGIEVAHDLAVPGQQPGRGVNERMRERLRPCARTWW
jgi:hypothetical protein